MASSFFSLEIADRVARLTLNQPQSHNAMTADFWRELPALLRALDEDGKARVVVLASEGRHFSSGMDLSVFRDGALAAPTHEAGRARLHLRETVLALQETFTALERLRIPVLAAVQGGCIGGALDLVTACDCRYASEDAYFVIQEINLGMTADLGTFPRLCKLMPEGMVREMAYTGRRLPAARARELGLVNAVFPDQATMLAEVTAIARDIAAKSPLAVAGSKAMIHYARDHSVADALNQVATWQAGMYHPESDMLESFAARGEKRDPRYPDLAPPARPFLAKDQEPKD